MALSYRRVINLTGIMISGRNLERTSQVRFLGVELDENLKFDKHIQMVHSKISKSLGILTKLKYYLPIQVMHTLHDSFIVPYLTHALEVWGGSSVCYTDRLFKLQKSFLRSAYNPNHPILSV